MIVSINAIDVLHAPLSLALCLIGVQNTMFVL